MVARKDLTGARKSLRLGPGEGALLRVGTEGEYRATCRPRHTHAESPPHSERKTASQAIHLGFLHSESISPTVRSTRICPPSGPTRLLWTMAL